MESLLWTDKPSLSTVLDQARVHSAAFILIEPQAGAISTDEADRIAALHPSSDIIVVYNPNDPARNERLLGLLPPYHSLLAALPHREAVLISASALTAHISRLAVSASWCEVVIQLAESGTIAFALGAPSPIDSLPIPQFTSPSRSTTPWLKRFIPQVRLPGISSTNLAALHAGLFLLNDFADDSHSCSQSIEGMGHLHLGDYWHAVLHRREPDYGNAKYWFRHVGQHPLFDNLAEQVRHLLQDSASLPTKLKPWSDSLQTKGTWDPFSFVDLCATAEDDPQLQSWCERIQYAEMMALLECTYRVAMSK